VLRGFACRPSSCPPGSAPAGARAPAAAPAGRTASPRRPWRHLMPDIHADEPEPREPERLVFGDDEGSARAADRSRASRLTRRRGRKTFAETTTMAGAVRADRVIGNGCGESPLLQRGPSSHPEGFCAFPLAPPPPATTHASRRRSSNHPAPHARRACGEIHVQASREDPTRRTLTSCMATTARATVRLHAEPPGTCSVRAGELRSTRKGRASRLGPRRRWLAPHVR
jgi:hypothetical protein